MGLRVWDLGFRVWGLELVWGLGFLPHILECSVGFRVSLGRHVHEENSMGSGFGVIFGLRDFRLHVP